MDRLRANPALTSAVGGVLFGLISFVVGGSSLDLVGVVLAGAVGLVFALAMYGSFRRGTRP